MVLRLSVCLSGSLVICLHGSRIVCVSVFLPVCLVGCLVLSVWLVLFCLPKWSSSAWISFCQSIWKVIDLFFCLTFVCVFRFFLRLSVCQSGILFVWFLCPIEWFCLSVCLCLLSLSVWMILSVCLCLISYLCVCLSDCSPVYFQEWRPGFSSLYLSVIPIFILIIRTSFYYFY